MPQIDITREELDGLMDVLNIAFEDQEQYLNSCHPEMDYGVEWPAARDLKLYQFGLTASVLDKVGMHASAKKWRELADSLRAEIMN